MKYTYDYEKKGEIYKFNETILMSNSPRRIEMLSFLHPKSYKLKIDERKIEEKYMKIYEEDVFLERAAKTCCEIAKAKSNVNLLKDTLYISSDTMVLHENKIYNKPKDKEEARNMLLSYFGKVHSVVTSVALRMDGYLEVFYTISNVSFVEYNKNLGIIIDEYIKSNKPMDKAGAYGIQELNPLLISYIEGNMNTIMGLPVSELGRRIYKGMEK